jgi:hypothetical protein
MKLIYRGLSFDYDPAKSAACRPCDHPQTSQTPYELIYRGNKYRLDPNAIKKVPVQPVTYKLIYRAITYWVNRNEQSQVKYSSSICAETNAKPEIQLE